MKQLLSARNITYEYCVRGTRMWQRKLYRAVNDVSLTVSSGETLGLVGESGSGKSTIAKLLSGQMQPTSGDVSLELQSGRQAFARARRDVQMVFQDASGALDPRWQIWRLVEEPLFIQKVGTKDERLALAYEALRAVGLGPEHYKRYPNELSGGQRQRVVIARALVLKPKFVICDEAVSALDVSVQAQILDLLRRLQDERGIGYLFISHDLRVIREISHRVAVLHRGRLVEVGPTEEVFARPAHPYTRSLIDAIPQLDPRRRRSSGPQERESRPAIAGSDGCHFRHNCSKSDLSCVLEPPLIEFAAQRASACWRAADKRADAA